MCAHANNSIQPLKAGDIMSPLPALQDDARHHVCVSTSSFAELLRLLCESDECSDIKLRRDEKKVLKELNQSDIVRSSARGYRQDEKLSVSKVIQHGRVVSHRGTYYLTSSSRRSRSYRHAH